MSFVNKPLENSGKHQDRFYPACRHRGHNCSRMGEPVLWALNRLTDHQQTFNFFFCWKAHACKQFMNHKQNIQLLLPLNGHTHTNSSWTISKHSTSSMESLHTHTNSSWTIGKHSTSSSTEWLHTHKQFMNHHQNIKLLPMNGYTHKQFMNHQQKIQLLPLNGYTQANIWWTISKHWSSSSVRRPQHMIFLQLFRLYTKTKRDRQTSRQADRQRQTLDTLCARAPACLLFQSLVMFEWKDNCW